MIEGIGTDIIEISRIKKNVENNSFLKKVFTEKEIEYCQNYRFPEERFAGRFAAKEAIVKALGIGFKTGLHWKDIEILNNALGKPELTLSENLINKIGNVNIKITLSHCKEYAVAFAILEK